MNILPDELVVLDIAGDRASLLCPDAQKRQALLSIGFSAQGDRMARPIASDIERLDLVRKLIKLGALFSDGTGWAPSELVAMYKDKGAIQGFFLKISWNNPSNYIITPS